MEGDGRLAERIPARLTPEEGRKFGVTVGLAFAVLAAISLWRGHDTAPLVLGVLGGALVLAGIAIPGHLGPVYRGWMRFALLISKVTTPIFMGLIYFLVLTPTSIVMRLLGHNPLVRKNVDDSYWITRGPARESSSMSRQF
jgi:hypothetical protein